MHLQYCNKRLTFLFIYLLLSISLLGQNYSWHKSPTDSLNVKHVKVDIDLDKENFMYSYDSIKSFKIPNDTKFHKKLKFNNTILSGYLFSRFTQFYDSVIFCNTVFSNDIAFRRDKFLNNVNFSNSSFHNIASFIFSSFSEDVNFASTKFSNEAHFDKTLYFGRANFGASNYINEVSFFDSEFKDTVNFGGAKFLNLAYFRKAKFSKGAFFYGAQFSGLAFFLSTTFSEKAYFEATDFMGSTNFNEATFSNKVDFFRATFGNRLLLNNLKLCDKTEFNFNLTTFPDTIEFSSNTEIFNEIDFTIANFNDHRRQNSKTDEEIPILIFLYKTDISKLHLDYIHFKLLLPDGTTNQNRSENEIFDVQTRITIDDCESMYEALLNNFKAHGQQESYKRCDIDYQTFKWHHSWAKWFAWLPRLWWNFGYNKELIFSRTLYLIGLFTFFTYFFIYFLNDKVYAMNNIPLDERWKKIFAFKNFGNRLWYSFIYTSAVFFRLTLKIENIHFERKWGTAYLILIYTLGLICLAYMANFVLQK